VSHKPLPKRLLECTPWKPDHQSILRVKNPLPPPLTCRYCGAPVEIKHNSFVYGTSYGDWPWLYICMSSTCGAYVGMHPFTAIPLGIVADRGLRRLRNEAKSLLNPLWQTRGAPMNRTDAYGWLAQALGIPDREQCHIGWFDDAKCIEAIAVLKIKRGIK
jgi:hypothetical protein